MTLEFLAIGGGPLILDDTMSIEARLYGIVGT